jgi:molybdopterin-guanine dinucleotide biosynthesis protein A
LEDRIAAVILAGGLSSRMGVEKALMPLGGQPVIAHVIARLRPQVARLAINANGNPARFSDFELPVLPDADNDRQGPLAGVLAGLRWARESGFDWLATAPCDAPFLPRDLVLRLAAHAVAGRSARAMNTAREEPLFALWSVAMIPHVERALREHRLAVHEFQQRQDFANVEIGNQRGAPDWTLNLNRREDHAAALRIIESGR